VNFLTDFTPTVRNSAQKKNSSKTGVIVGVVVGAAVLGVLALAGICMWRQKRRKLLLEQQGKWDTMITSTIYYESSLDIVFINLSFVMFSELYSIVGRPNVFVYGELRTATENFSSNNLLGEGGYGSVYKVSLSIVLMDVNLYEASESNFPKLFIAKGYTHVFLIVC
jgi:hypothetical protein